MFNVSEEQKFFNRTVKDLNALLSAAGKPLCRVNFTVANNPAPFVVLTMGRTFTNCWSTLLDVLQRNTAPTYQQLAQDATMSPVALRMFRAGISQRIIRAFTDSVLGVSMDSVHTNPEALAWQSCRVRYLRLRSTFVYLLLSLTSATFLVHRS